MRWYSIGTTFPAIPRLRALGIDILDYEFESTSVRVRAWSDVLPSFDLDKPRWVRFGDPTPCGYLKHEVDLDGVKILLRDLRGTPTAHVTAPCGEVFVPTFIPQVDPDQSVSASAQMIFDDEFKSHGWANVKDAYRVRSHIPAELKDLFVKAYQDHRRASF